MKDNFIAVNEDFFNSLVQKVVAQLKEDFPKAREESEWISGQEVMDILGIKKSKLQLLRDDGSINFSYITRKNLKYSKSSVYSLIHSRQANNIQ